MSVATNNAPDNGTINSSLEKLPGGGINIIEYNEMESKEKLKEEIKNPNINIQCDI